MGASFKLILLYSLGVVLFIGLVLLLIYLLYLRSNKLVTKGGKFQIDIKCTGSTGFSLRGKLKNGKDVTLMISEFPELVDYILHHELCVGDEISIDLQGNNTKSFQILKINKFIRSNNKLKFYEIRINEIGTDKIPAYKPITSKLAECYDGDIDASYMMYQYNGSFWYEKE